jgi:hypothetical protein
VTSELRKEKLGNLDVIVPVEPDEHQAATVFGLLAGSIS